MQGEDAGTVEQARALVRHMRTLHLASVGGDGAPEASYAPFVAGDGALWLFLSRLARHTGNLLARPTVAVLLVRDEADSPEPFARVRLSMRCAVSEERRGSRRWQLVLDAFEARFGDTAATVRALPDFHLFRLRPLEGRFVGGFARARALRTDTLAGLLGWSAPAGEG